jgi:hypothetical protein
MTPNIASFADLLRSAVTDPGVVSGAYCQFHTYSIGNQLLACTTGWRRVASSSFHSGACACSFSI